MKNLAGDPDCDSYIEQELTRCGIEVSDPEPRCTCEVRDDENPVCSPGCPHAEWLNRQTAEPQHDCTEFCQHELEDRVNELEGLLGAARAELSRVRCRLVDITDDLLGLQPPDADSIELLNALEKQCNEWRIDAFKGNPARAGIADAAVAWVQSDGRKNEPTPFHTRAVAAMETDRLLRTLHRLAVNYAYDRDRATFAAPEPETDEGT